MCKNNTKLPYSLQFVEWPKIFVSPIIVLVKNHFPSHLSNGFPRQKQLSSYWIKQHGSICDDINAWLTVKALSLPSLHPSVAFIRTIKCAGHIQENNTAVSHLPIVNSDAYSGIHKGEIESKATGRRWRFPLIQGGWKIPCYVALHGKKWKTS